MSNNSMPQIIKLSITNLAYGGKGIARHDEKVYFIANAVTGDEVLCEITNSKKNFAEGIIKDFIKKSPSRQTSECQYSDECGGCQWQEIPYETQLQWKKSFIEDAFSRIAKTDYPKPLIIHPSPEIYHYRNRVTLRGTIKKNGTIKIGYFKASTRDQIHISNCKIAHESINKLISDINKTRTSSVEQKFRLEVQQVPIKSSGKSSLLVTLFPIIKPYSKIEDFFNSIKSNPLVHWVGYSSELKEAPSVLFEEDTIKYFSTPGQFQQVNTEHNITLRNIVKEITNRIDANTIFDLYCGSGNLSLHLLNQNRSIEGIEFNQIAIKNAKKNVKENSLRNANYQSGDAFKRLDQLIKTKNIIDLLIVDPPRKGMKDIIPLILNFKPKHILYISCDPTTMARDVKSLNESYKLISLEGLDFFPHTYHIESVALLKRIED